ncbi:MAG: DNA polymerase III subunit gamma/tau [Gemmatimonadota bacterium]
MIALARKYRPKSFATVAVQSHVSNTLKGAISRGRIAHGYLLCGPRGVGKTTLARVLAMALNCEDKQPDAEPCGRCTTCQRIWSGSPSLDVVEIDAASNRGVDDARDLRERAMYAPSGDDRYKVYIIDEAHMLTREAWNALLKILEEPPPRVVFVFATTEPHKIAQAAAPVLSRLQRFDFRRMSVNDIRTRLIAVLDSEGIEAEHEALAMIARAADGSMRDGLSLTDQVLALGDGQVTASSVREALGLVAEEEYLALLDAIVERRASDVLPMMTRLIDSGVDLGQFLVGLSDMLRAFLAVELGAPDAGVSAAARDQLEARRGRLLPADILRMLSAIAALEPDFRRSTQQQILLEALLVRFALLDRTVDIQMLLERLDNAPPGDGGRGDRGERTNRPTPASPTDRSRSRSRPDPDPGVPPAPRAAPEVKGKGDEGRQAPARSGGAPGQSPASAVRETNDKKHPTPAPVGLDLNAIAGRWDDLVEAVRASRPIVGAMLAHAVPSAVTAGGVLTLALDDSRAYEGLQNAGRDLLAAFTPHIAGLTRVALLQPDNQQSAAPRITAESRKAETLSSLRKKDAVIATAIDVLDLELMD